MINHYYINKLGDLQLLKIWTDIGAWKLRKWGNCWFFYEGPFNHTNIYKFGLKLFVRFQIYKYLDADHFFKRKPKLRFWCIGQSASPLYVLWLYFNYDFDLIWPCLTLFYCPRLISECLFTYSTFIIGNSYTLQIYLCRMPQYKIIY